MMRQIQDGLRLAVRGGLAAAMLAGVLAGAQTAPAPAAAKDKQGADKSAAGQGAPAKDSTQGKAKDQNAAPDAPAPSPAQQFAFPEEDSKSKDLGEQRMLPAAPDAPAPNVPAPAGGGGYSSSEANASGDLPAESVPDAAGGNKPELHDEGSSGHVDTARADKDLSVADFYIKDGNYKGAYLRYKDAVVFDPDDADAHFGLAEMARKTGKPEEAIEQYAATVKVDPKGRHAKEAQRALVEMQASAAPTVEKK